MPKTKTASQRGSLFDSLRSLADEVQFAKTASARTKTAGPTPSDPGGYQGATTHPVKDVDNNVQDASEGARSTENTADVKADNPAASVDATSEATPGSGEDKQFNIGTQQSATGEDSSVEDDYKGGKDDPGSSHPARTDNKSLDGEKYSSVSFKEAHDRSTHLANQLLADLANGFGNQLISKRAAEGGKGGMKGHGSSDPNSETPLSNPETSQDMGAVGGDASGEHVQTGGGGEKSSMASRLKAAQAALAQPQQPAYQAEAGYELAAMLGIDKHAAYQGVQSCIQQTIKDAQHDATLFGQYYLTFADRMQKQGMGGDEETGEDHSAPGDDSSGGGGGGGSSEGDPAGAGGGGGGGLEELLGGGGGDPMGGGGGGGMGGDPMGGGMGGDPMGGGEPSQEEAIAQLAAALEELGIPLEALVGGAGGGGEMGGGMGGGEMGGGPPPGGDPMGGGGGGMGGGDPMAGMGGGAPPPGGDPMAGMKAAQARQELVKLAHAVKQYKRSGRHQMGKAASNQRERVLRDMMKGHLLELIGQRGGL